MFSLYNVNNGSLGHILSSTLNSASNSSIRHDANIAQANVDFDDDSSDDCEMMGGIIPLPLASTSEGLIKRDNDKISNNKPFITTVSCMPHIFLDIFIIDISVIFPFTEEWARL